MEAEAVARNWIDDFLYMRDSQDWGVMTLTFHPHVIGRGHRRRMFGRLLERLLKEGARFVTLSQALVEYRSRFPKGRSLPP
jgi:peptidoglycan-N-acetylglucosamine deacetylase